ncbi:MAG: hypothetical protein F6J97_08185 [Leptolyngbya sp. SIO4C1]|nr:hypothetical protein [Leptolyngbya sp. SIO4C1]
MSLPFGYSANFKVLGKTEPQNLSYAGAFEATNGNFTSLADHIGKGHPWMPALLDGDRTRRQQNANYTELLAADVDGGLSIEQALQNPFISQHCGLGIETASSTPELSKFRLVFRLARPVKGWQQIRICYCYLIEVLAVADSACKDASRFFFGAPGREAFLLDESAVLPESFLADAIAWHKAKQQRIALEKAEREAQRKVWCDANPIEGTDQIDLVRQALACIPPYTPGNGTYDGLRTTIAGVLNELGAEGEALLREWDGGLGQWGRGGFDRILKSIERSHSSRKAGLGSLFHLARQYGFEFPQTNSQVTRQTWEKGQKGQLLKAVKTSAETKPKLFDIASKAKRDEDVYWTEFAKQLNISLPENRQERRAAVEAELRKRQLLPANHIEGQFTALSLAVDGTRKLYILDGQKCTRKTSGAGTGLFINAIKVQAKSLAIAPTRVLVKDLVANLNRALKAVLGNNPSDERHGNWAAHHMQASWWNYPIAVTCPESVHKVAEENFELVFIDEANEDLQRVFDGSLGTEPTLCRKALAKVLGRAKTVAISTDAMYRVTVSAVQRLGGFAPSEIETIQRKRPQNPNISIYLYHDNAQVRAERWDGAKGGPPQSNRAFYSWLNQLIKEIEAGKRISIPCGSQSKARLIHRILREHFKGSGKKGQVLDGKFTPGKVKGEFANGCDDWLYTNQPDWLIFTPVFNSGVSIESEYFDSQFEYISGFEGATAASQRGERVRDVIFGKRINARYIYTTNRGLSKHPDIDLFFPDFWRGLLTAEKSLGLSSATGVAKAIGALDFLNQHQNKSQLEIDEIRELPEFWAIQARELYFKLETLTSEWIGNGWKIQQANLLEPSETEHLKESVAAAEEQAIGRLSRATALARPDFSESDEPAGPLQTTKRHKADLVRQFGAWDKLSLLEKVTTNGTSKIAPWLAAWDAAPDARGKIKAIRIRALIHIGLYEPELWQGICHAKALRAIAIATDEHSLPDLPAAPHEIELAQLVLEAPLIPEILKGKITNWTKLDCTAVAAYARQNAQRLSALSRHSQRIHGLQFTPQTPDTKCLHKLLQIPGYEAVTDGREAGKYKYWRYRLRTLSDIEGRIAQLLKKGKSVSAADERDRYRYETAEETMNRAKGVMKEIASGIIESWGQVAERIKLKIQENQPDPELQYRDNPSTEVLDPSPNPPPLESEPLSHLQQICLDILRGCDHWGQYLSIYQCLGADDTASLWALLTPDQQQHILVLQRQRVAA